MKNTPTYRLTKLSLEEKPEQKEVLEVFYELADTVSQLHPYTAKDIIDKTPFSLKNLERLKETLQYAAEKQNAAHFQLNRLEYEQSVNYVNDIVRDMTEQNLGSSYINNESIADKVKSGKIVKLQTKIKPYSQDTVYAKVI